MCRLHTPKCGEHEIIQPVKAYGLIKISSKEAWRGNSQSHVKTQHEADQTPSQENHGSGEVNPNELGFARRPRSLLQCLCFDILGFFGVSLLLEHAFPDDWSIGFAQEKETQDTGNETYPWS